MCSTGPHLLNVPAAEAAWAQCARTPKDPDRTSPCPPHLLPLPSTLHEITEHNKSQLEIRAPSYLGSDKCKKVKWTGEVSLINIAFGLDTNPYCHL